MQKLLRIPELLAPAGNVECFFAALNSGADAVYLGLNKYSARASAENFSIKLLQEVVPVAHAFGMKVFVAINTLLFDNEIPELLSMLEALENIQIDAVIVQDLGLIKLLKYFPSLKMHASTQMAIHNSLGVHALQKLGFKRIVLARELSINEIKFIKAQMPGIEIEVFCHGSLCFSLSGLCLFGGITDAKSGNRGECSYGCRKNYNVTCKQTQGNFNNTPLFNTCDLDTSTILSQLNTASVHTLKIEGRKKDAIYVSQVVLAYRKMLNAVYLQNTLRESAPQGAHMAILKSDNMPNLGATFQRQSTTLFLDEKLHVPTLSNKPAHIGVVAAQLISIINGYLLVEATIPLFLHDGLSISTEGAIFSFGISELRNTTDNKSMFSTIPGQKILLKPSLPIPPQFKNLKNLDIYRVRSSSLKEEIGKIAKPPLYIKPNYLLPVNIDISIASINKTNDIFSFSIKVSHCKQTFFSETLEFTCADLIGKPQLSENHLKAVQELFGIWGKYGFYANELNLELNSLEIPLKQLKSIKNQLGQKICESRENYINNKHQNILHINDKKNCSKQSAIPKINLVVNASNAELLMQNPPEYLRINQIFLNIDEGDLNKNFETLAKMQQVIPPEKLGVRLPTVIFDEQMPVVRDFISKAQAINIDSFLISNIFHKELLSNVKGVSLHADYFLYCTNAFAALTLQELQCKSYTINPEFSLQMFDEELLSSVFPLSTALIYGDIPLFTSRHQVCSKQGQLLIQQNKNSFIANHNNQGLFNLYNQKPLDNRKVVPELLKKGLTVFRFDFLHTKYTRNIILDFFAE